MESTEVSARFDMVVVGAGLSGIVGAARYLQTHQHSKVTLLEQDYCLGGVWSERRIYPSFWSQWAHGIAEFADMTMTRPPAEDCKNDLFRAKYTTKYLEEYVDRTHIGGQSLRDRIQFSTRVVSVTKSGDEWCLDCIQSQKEKNCTPIFAAKLIIADGQASLPRMPQLPGKESFKGTILHSVDFGQCDVIANDKYHHLAVLGGGKSAADMVYEAVKACKTVSWIIRKTGDNSTGPGFFAPADVPTPYQNPGSAAQTRVMSSLQPTFLNADTWWTRFLHGTTMGVGLVKWIFSKADAQVLNRARYHDRKSTKGFEKLQIDSGLFWQNGTGGVLHHDDFFELVAEKVTIHRARVQKLLGHELYLDDIEGTHFPCDAVLCGTGWERGLEMFDNELRMQLGLPYPKTKEPVATRAKWEALESEADEKVLEKYLILRDPPPHAHVYESRTPYRLYRGMAPLNDDSILFMNHVTVSNKLFGAEAQAMWAVAYFDGNIDLPPLEKREQDIATWVAWCRRRYLSNGELGNYIAFDGVPYVDSLLEEMGLTAHRQKGWLRNFFAPVKPADLGKAWKEYLDAHTKIGLSLTQSVLFAYTTKYGFGMHLWDIRASNLLHVLKLFAAALKIYMPTILAVKLCLLLNYHRVFQIDQKTKHFIWFGVVANTAFYVTFFFVDLFRCKPMEAAWNPMVKGKCIPYAFFPWVTGIFNVVSDFYILILPMPLLVGLNMPRARRVRLVAIFGLGLFTCVTSIMRVIATKQASSKPDKMYYGAKEMHWPILEVNVGLICACAVTFPAFFDSSLPGSFGSFGSKKLRLSSASNSRTNIAAEPGVLQIYNSSEKSSYSVDEGSTKVVRVDSS